MRFWLFILCVLCGAHSILAQNIQPNFTRQQVQHLLKEKIRVRDLGATIEWMRQHPEQAPQFQQFAQQHTSASDRSAEIVVHNDDKAESEVHAAINPTDTNNIIVASIIQDVDNVFAPIDVPVHYSKDFGKSWQSSTIQFNPELDKFVGGGGDPVLAFDKSGKAFLSWLALTVDILSDTPLKLALYMSVSGNKGQTWSDPVVVDFGVANLEVITGGPDPKGEFVDKQWMAVDRTNSAKEGNLYVSYTRFEIIDSATATSNIFLKTKLKNNAAFNATATKVNTGNYAFIQFSSIDVDAQGGVHVSFVGGASDTDLALYHAISSDGGASFLPENKISDINFPGLGDAPANPIEGIAEGRLYPCPHLRVGKQSNSMYAVWSSDGLQQQETEGYDVWFTKSVTNGQTWSAPVRINEGSNPLAEQFYPAITVSPNGTICLSYYDRTDDPNGANTHYVVSYSFDGGNTFTPPAKATSVPSDFLSIGDLNQGFGIGEYTQVVSTDYFAIPVWADGRDNNGDIDIYAAILPISKLSSSTGEIGTITDAFSVETPNPALGKLDVRVDLKKASRLSVQVFSNDGRLAAQQGVSSRREAGIYQFAFPLAAGHYLCRVETEHGFKIRRVVVE